MIAKRTASGRLADKLSAGIFALVLAPALMLYGGPDEASAADRLNVSYIGSGAATIPLFIARDKGYFEEVGIDLNAVSFVSSPFPQAVAGEIDIVSTDNANAFQAAVGGLEIVFLGETSRLRDGIHQFVVNGDSPITDATDLRGAKIGVGNLIGSARFALDGLLERGGLTMDDVEVVEITRPALGPALDMGNIQVAHLSSTLLDLAVRERGVRSIGDFAELGLEGLPQAAYYATRRAYDADPDKFHRFMEAYMRGVEDAHADEVLVRRYYKELSGYTDEVVERLPIPSMPREADPERLQGLADLMLEKGMLDSPLVIGEGRMGLAAIHQ